MQRLRGRESGSGIGRWRRGCTGRRLKKGPLMRKGELGKSKIYEKKKKKKGEFMVEI